MNTKSNGKSRLEIPLVFKGWSRITGASYSFTATALLMLLLQGCIAEKYIPPATATMPKSQLIHVSQLNAAKYVVRQIGGVVVDEPVFGGSHRPYDFYMLPGTYNVDFTESTLYAIVPGPFGPLMIGKTNGASAVVTFSPELAGKKVIFKELLRKTNPDIHTSPGRVIVR